ncbi:winged helix-turn-helix transcriptional regulator [Amycolatopsis jiangsuensis]|uniref:DNA-binding HxlR family transcriptional regulator n=1 Tax=Amycolatopsis jiangsuensis TaxID=1181879 RepID=A0A840J3C2_9PSEU|nr:helix-turn-helix domain-containing protein [Amycolatopsis jiangsuensis]MBB4689561.1 DNA-binding HxlR family transcriptional regulator [Amycolatopsis jiangsuensis]
MSDEHAGQQEPSTVRAMPGFEHIDEELCRSFRDSAELVGRKWTAGILLAGILGARRFVEYRAHVEGISDRLLAQRMRELEAEGLLDRHVTPTTPVLVTYLPSERAVGLMRALHPLVKWSIADRRCESKARPAAT